MFEENVINKGMTGLCDAKGRVDGDDTRAVDEEEGDGVGQSQQNQPRAVVKISADAARCDNVRPFSPWPRTPSSVPEHLSVIQVTSKMTLHVQR